jgi:hypothetical protein
MLADERAGTDSAGAIAITAPRGWTASPREVVYSMTRAVHQGNDDEEPNCCLHFVIRRSPPPIAARRRGFATRAFTRPTGLH